MKVVFWNGISPFDGMTDYVAAIGTMLSLEYNCEVVLSSNYISNHMLQDCFFYKIKEKEIAHVSYRYLHDTPEYYNALWNMKRNRQGDILEIPMEGLTIIFPPDVAEKRMFYYKVPGTTFYLLDLARGNSSIYQSVLEESDVIIVFLPQDVVEIQNFFYRFSSLIPKAIFVIEESHRPSRNFYHKLVEGYGINYSNIGRIPQSKECRAACEEGKLESFLRSNQSTKSTQYNFVSGIKSIARLLYERSIPKQIKECEERYEAIKQNDGYLQE